MVGNSLTADIAADIAAARAAVHAATATRSGCTVTSCTTSGWTPARALATATSEIDTEAHVLLRGTAAAVLPALLAG